MLLVFRPDVVMLDRENDEAVFVGVQEGLYWYSYNSCC